MNMNDIKVAGDFFSIFLAEGQDNEGARVARRQDQADRVRKAVRARFAKKWVSEVEAVVRDAWSR